MADVALRARVSPATVARVIYANGYVSAQKRALIEDAVRATGYRPNVMARALRTARSFTIGLVLSEGRLNGFHPSVAREVQVEALRHGYTVLTLNNSRDVDKEDAGVARFIDQHVDAIIFCAAINPANVRLATSVGIPAVQVEREVVPDGWQVSIDPMPGMKQAVGHLRKLGHRRIAYIGPAFVRGEETSERWTKVEAQRLACFRKAMLGSRLTLEDDLVMLAPYDAPVGERQPGYTRMTALLNLPQPPTAVVTGADLLAAGALQAIYEAGLRIPDDISLVGYDDVMAEMLTPPLSCIAQPIADLGRLAVQLALEGLATEVGLPRRENTETHFVTRDSTGRCRRETTSD